MMFAKSLSMLALGSVVEAGRSGNLRKRDAGALQRGLSVCAENESSWSLSLTVDDYPWETRWTIKDLSGNKVAFGPPDDMNYEKRGSYEDAGCLPAGDYIFTVKDRSGDGMCCMYGEGKYEFRVDDFIVAESNDGAFKTLDFPFTVANEINADSIETISSETGDASLATDAPSTSRPSMKPVTSSPSAHPTESPSFSPTGVPTTPPTTKKPTTSPSNKPTAIPSSPPTLSPSKKPTGMPATPWPTYEPSESPTLPPSSVPSATPSFLPSFSPIKSPTLPPSSVPSASPSFLPSFPITSNPTISPSMDTAEVPSKTDSTTSIITQSKFTSQTSSETSTSIAMVEEPTVTAAPSLHPSLPPSTTRLVVPMTPFSVFLTTNENEIDLNEFNTILTDHLMAQMLANLPKSTEVSKVDLQVVDVTMSDRVLKNEEVAEGNVIDVGTNETGTDSSQSSSTTTHEISVSGDASFAGTALPTTEQLDDVTAAAFEGEAGNELIQSLLSAEDPGLQSTVGLSVPVDDYVVEYHEGYLNKPVDSPPYENAFNLLYVVGALFVVGLLLVAAFVHRTRQMQRNRAMEVDDFVEEPNGVDGEDDGLPAYIDIKQVDQCEQCDGGNDCDPVVQDCAEGCGVSYCFIESIQEAPSISQASTEVASNQTYSNDRNTLDSKEELVTLETYDASGISNNRSLQLPPLYQIHENEEDKNQNTGYFCGFNNAVTATQKEDDKSRFGTESQWGMKPTNSEDTSEVQQKGRCSTACNEL